jgi:5-methylthioadenosine/S-adenosylhomocysteine deaminase
MIPVDHIVFGDYLLPMAGDAFVVENGAVAVKDGRIFDAGDYGEITGKYSSQSHIGGRSRAVMPGLVNTHAHAAMVFLRGMADDLPLKEWLEKHIWPVENRWLSKEYVRDATELACIEMLRAGITTFADMYFFEDVTGDAARALGMRAVLGQGVLDFPTRTTGGADDCLRKADGLIGKWKGDELITPSIAPHSTYGCGPETIKKVRDAALGHGVLVHTHLSETRWEVEEAKKNHGRTPVELLDGLGLFECKVIAAHCVWVTEEEMDIFARKGVGVSHCVKSNLKLASGIAPVPRMIEKGINVSLGTDGAASNNDLDILGEMSCAARLHKAAAGEPTALDARTALLMATRRGAEAVGLENTGSLEKGKAGDIIVLDLDKPHLTPLYGICSHLVYSARSTDVETVMVNGKVVVEGGRLLTADENEIMGKAREWGRRIKEGAEGPD